MTKVLNTPLKALYDYDYKTSDGRDIVIRQGDTFTLLKKSNEDWWQVIRDGEHKPIYVPAAYVKELDYLDKTKQQDKCHFETDKNRHGDKTGTSVYENIYKQSAEWRHEKERSYPGHHNSQELLQNADKGGNSTEWYTEERDLYPKVKKPPIKQRTLKTEGGCKYKSRSSENLLDNGYQNIKSKTSGQIEHGENRKQNGRHDGSEKYANIKYSSSQVGKLNGKSRRVKSEENLLSSDIILPIQRLSFHETKRQENQEEAILGSPENSDVYHQRVYEPILYREKDGNGSKSGSSRGSLTVSRILEETSTYNKLQECRSTSAKRQKDSGFSSLERALDVQAVSQQTENLPYFEPEPDYDNLPVEEKVFVGTANAPREFFHFGEDENMYSELKVSEDMQKTYHVSKQAYENPAYGDPSVVVAAVREGQERPEMHVHRNIQPDERKKVFEKERNEERFDYSSSSTSQVLSFFFAFKNTLNIMYYFTNIFISIIWCYIVIVQK